MEFAEKVCAKLWMSVEKKENGSRSENAKNTAESTEN